MACESPIGRGPHQQSWELGADQLQRQQHQWLPGVLVFGSYAVSAGDPSLGGRGVSGLTFRGCRARAALDRPGLEKLNIGILTWKLPIF